MCNVKMIKNIKSAYATLIYRTLISPTISVKSLTHSILKKILNLFSKNTRLNNIIQMSYKMINRKLDIFR